MIRDDYNEQLEVLRNKLNEIDHELISLLIKRFSITDEVGTLKSRFDKPIFESNRERHIKDRIKMLVSEAEQAQISGTEPANGTQPANDLSKLNAESIIKIYECIFEESKKRQIQ